MIPVSSSRVAPASTTEPSSTTVREWAVLALVAILGQAAWTAWLAVHTDSPAPFWDAAVLVLSLIATYGQAKKLLESWFVWIAVDAISVPLYLSRGLRPTALLFLGFGVLCVLGLRDWSRSLRADRAAVVLEVAA